jgi:hypothetical protein
VTLDPNPDGWFRVCNARELGRGSVARKVWGGDVFVHRPRRGVEVSDAHGPLPTIVRSGLVLAYFSRARITEAHSGLRSPRSLSSHSPIFCSSPRPEGR